MKLLLVRHGDALSAAAAQAAELEDADRPLTPAGEEQVRAMGRLLAGLVPELDGLLHSPLLRAEQTANLLAPYWPVAPIQSCGALRDIAEPKAVVAALPPVNDGTVALVGHEPSLSGFAAWLTDGTAVPRFSLGKGGAALISCRNGITAGSGKLRWLLPPETAVMS